MQTLICSVPDGTVIDLSSASCPGTWQVVDGDPIFTLVFLGFSFVIAFLAALTGRMW